MRSIHEWRLVPPSLLKGSNLPDKNSASDGVSQEFHDIGMFPSSIYGPVHLLRLFVKMPEILGRMKIPTKTSKLIIKYMDSLLEYLEGQPNLFTAESVYEQM